MANASTDPLPNGRERLLRVGMRLFAERGIDGVSVRDIASAADVSIGLIKHHFGSKEGLRQECDAWFLSRFESFYENRKGTEPTGEAPHDYVSMAVEHWINDVEEDWPLISAYFRRALLEETEWGAQLFQRYYQLIRDAIDRSDAKGQIREDVDRLWLPFLYIFLQTGTLLLDPYIQRIIGRSGFDRDLWKRRHKAYEDLIFRGAIRNRNDRS